MTCYKSVLVGVALGIISTVPCYAATWDWALRQRVTTRESIQVSNKVIDIIHDGVKVGRIEYDFDLKPIAQSYDGESKAECSMQDMWIRIIGESTIIRFDYLKSRFRAWDFQWQEKPLDADLTDIVAQSPEVFSLKAKSYTDLKSILSRIYREHFYQAVLYSEKNYKGVFSKDFSPTFEGFNYAASSFARNWFPNLFTEIEGFTYYRDKVAYEREFVDGLE